MKHFLEHLQESMVRFWDAPCVSDYNGGTYTFAEMASMMARLHVVYEGLGLKGDDKIALCAKNSAHWAVSFMSIVTYGSVAVPLLADFNPSSVNSLVAHADTSVLLTDPEKWSKYDVSMMGDKIRCVISTADFTPLYADEKAAAIFKDLDRTFAERYPEGVRPSDIKFDCSDIHKLTLINYTSGTTSAPKGVMLTAESLSSNVEFGMWGIPTTVGNNVVSMLPMAHMYGLAFEFLYPLCSGCHIYFLGAAPTPKILLKAFADVHPYMIITVPLVIEKIFKNNILPLVSKPAVRVLTMIPGVRNIIFSKIRKKLLDTFGGRIDSMIIGGAAINHEIEMWMKRIGLPYTVGYGMTECGPLLGYENHRKFKMQSCGKIVHRMEIRVDSDDPKRIPGELQVRGANVMIGYYKNEAATREAFTSDGWMRTGDLGIVDAEGNIFIKGRSKNMILSASGQNIYPEEIESILNNMPYMLESVVVARNNVLVALVYPDYDKIKADGMDDEAVKAMLEHNRNRLNAGMPVYSKLAAIELVSEPFEKTPKMSIKRFLYK